MEAYFENDPDKQEMLKYVIVYYMEISEEDKFWLDKNDYVEKVKELIERITEDKIEEILK